MYNEGWVWVKLESRVRFRMYVCVCVCVYSMYVCTYVSTCLLMSALRPCFSLYLSHLLFVSDSLMSPLTRLEHFLTNAQAE